MYITQQQSSNCQGSVNPGKSVALAANFGKTGAE